MMISNATSKLVTIFEGPDGGGKTTLARAYAEATGARYVHFDRFPRIHDAQLGRLYVEAMLPALLGYQDVVLDRCWLSEPVYGMACRAGKLRITEVHARMLERLAMRCGAVVVYCLPPRDTVFQHYHATKRPEYTQPQQISEIYDRYQHQQTGLPAVVYDYTKCDNGPVGELVHRLAAWRFPCHRLDVRSAGNAAAEVILVGEAFAEVKPADPLYQWPFASFGKAGCSYWLTQQLYNAGTIPEAKLFWVNADQPLGRLKEYFDLETTSLVVTLGAKADTRLTRLGIQHETVPHPQFWTRFAAGERTTYPLLKLLDH